MYHAATQDYSKITRMLLAHGADPYVANHVSLAYSCDFLHQLRLLVNCCFSRVEPQRGLTPMQSGISKKIQAVFNQHLNPRAGGRTEKESSVLIKPLAPAPLHNVISLSSPLLLPMWQGSSEAGSSLPPRPNTHPVGRPAASVRFPLSPVLSCLSTAHTTPCPFLRCRWEVPSVICRRAQRYSCSDRHRNLHRIVYVRGFPVLWQRGETQRAQ